MKVSWDDDIPNIWKNMKNKSHVPNHQSAMIGGEDVQSMLSSIGAHVFIPKSGTDLPIVDWSSMFLTWNMMRFKCFNSQKMRRLGIYTQNVVILKLTQQMAS